MSNWTTPEEIARKRELKKKVVTISFFIFAIILGAVVTIAANGM